MDGHDPADGARAEVWNWLTRGRHPVTGLDQRLLAGTLCLSSRAWPTGSALC